MKFKKIYSICLGILLFFSSCIDTKVNSIFIDLDHAKNNLNYSSLFDRIEYINLDAGDECLLSGIKKIYFDSDTIIFQDAKNDDCIYSINNDSISKLYEIDLKQKIPLDIRTASSQSREDLNHRSMMFDFVPSPHAVLLCYFIFGEKENPYRYVLIDSKTKEAIIFKEFINDMDNTSFSDNKIFCINDLSWCRLSRQPENSQTVQLQVMHLRNESK